MSLERPSPVEGPPARTVSAGYVVRAVAFWSSVLLPLAYTPLLVAGIEGQRLSIFVALLALHVACLLVGHSHSPEYVK